MNRRDRVVVRGQVLVLACVFLLVLALSLALSFSVGTAVHERIRLQAHADSMAYSLAVLEARSLNAVAHTNRAIGASLSAQMSLHAYKAIGEHLVKQLDTSVDAFNYFAGLEQAKATIGDDNCAVQIHCTHAAEASVIAGKYAAESAAVRARVDAANSAWEDAVADLQKATDNIAKEQQNTVHWAMQQMKSGPVLEALRTKNAPLASEGNPLGVMSKGVFACSFEGLPSDSACQMPSSTNTNDDVADVAIRDTALGSMGMAARPHFTEGSTGTAQFNAAAEYTTAPNQQGLIDFPARMKAIQGGEDTWQYTITNSEGRLSNDGRTDFGSYEVSATLEGHMFVAWGNSLARHDGRGLQGNVNELFPQNYPADIRTRVFSERGSHGYEGLPCSQGYGAGCFVNLRLGSSTKNGFNQPSVYASTSQSLAILGRSPAGTRVPWQLNEKGEVNWKAGGDSSVLKMIPTGEGYAVSKAKVYFHQLGDWSVPPNSFDPYWRAKLHPFSRAELKEALHLAGDVAGESLAGRSEVPVEGSVGSSPGGATW